MKKCFVLDTNVLLTDPKSIYAFEEHDVVIPLVVLEELDNFKKGNDELARNAREVARELDILRDEGWLWEGVKLRTGGLLTVRYQGLTKAGIPRFPVGIRFREEN